MSEKREDHLPQELVRPLTPDELEGDEPPLCDVCGEPASHRVEGNTGSPSYTSFATDLCAKHVDPEANR